jgi:hypothetical protein
MGRYKRTLGFATFVVYVASYSLQVHCRAVATRMTREMGLAEADMKDLPSAAICRETTQW